MAEKAQTKALRLRAIPLTETERKQVRRRRAASTAAGSGLLSSALTLGSGGTGKQIAGVAGLTSAMGAGLGYAQKPPRHRVEVLAKGVSLSTTPVRLVPLPVRKPKKPRSTRVLKSYELTDSAFNEEVAKAAIPGLRQAGFAVKQGTGAVGSGLKSGWKGTTGATSGFGARLKALGTGFRQGAAPGAAQAQRSATAATGQARRGWNGARTATKVGAGAVGAGAVGGGSYYAGQRQGRKTY